MNVRATTVRRLSILLAGALLLVAIGAGLYLRNEHRKSEKLAAARAAGLAAFKAGDYRTALDQLKTYTSRVRGDNEALYAYAVARSRVETPNGSHITEGISALTTLLQQDPNNLDAEHRLLELDIQIFHNNDAVDLADSTLADHPDDRDALRGKCVALDRLHKYDAALAVSQKLNALEPTDLEQQLTTYKLMRASSGRMKSFSPARRRSNGNIPAIRGSNCCWGGSTATRATCPIACNGSKPRPHVQRRTRLTFDTWCACSINSRCIARARRCSTGQSRRIPIRRSGGC